uniref:Calponin-homology (CH) domain-containing protein n=1 Tax=Parascaris equorum TaxID=6256 RepID=A0A914RML4_PAREQ
LVSDYERLSTDLLEWIRRTIETLNDRHFVNSLTGVQKQLAEFNEKGELEVLLFTIQSRMRANNQRPYLPREGKLISDINRAWENLEKAEHERELALKEELIRQEKLEQLAARFDRKAGMRETWLSENQRLVSQDNFGTDLASVEHALLESDINIVGDRVKNVNGQAEKFTSPNGPDGSGYKPVEPSLVEERMKILVDRYAELQALSDERKRRLENNRRLCQFWWDVAELEQNLKESEQVRLFNSHYF